MDSDDEKSIAHAEDTDYEDDETIASQDYNDDDSDIDDDAGTDAGSDAGTIQDNNSETASINMSDDDDEDYDDDDDNEAYFEKLNGFSEKTIETHHPESVFHNYDEIETLSRVVRDSKNNIIDPFHKTLPIMTKYERARILGQRAKQIDSGAIVFVKTEDNIVDSYKIAEMELNAKKIPFIIKRPLPGGACEYWKIKDLEILVF
jgi:DNA-directed RNA polymerase I, II, and III subunit RPABC2